MHKGLYFAVALLWSAVIAYFCLMPASNLPTISATNLDKIVHAGFHFVFTICWFLFFKNRLNGSNLWRPLQFAFLLSMVFGISIEVIQDLFTISRRGDVIDVLANSTGAALAVCFILFVANYTASKNI